MKEVKELTKRILRVPYRFIRYTVPFSMSQNYRALKTSKDRIILVDTPRHGNLGDQAITLAEIQLFRTNYPKKEIIEFSYDDIRSYIKMIKKHVKANDVIAIHGGGFIGTLWINEHNNLLIILDAFKEKRLVIFPQTIYFEDSDYGHSLEKAFIEALAQCEKLTIFVRDRKSFEWLKENAPSNICYYLVPDIVTTYKYNRSGTKNNTVIFCFRNDLEKISNVDIDKIKQEFESMGFIVQESSTILDKRIAVDERLEAVNNKLDEFSKASLIITDRLHGMILSAIAETPCYALDNVSHKVSGGFEWIKHLGYVECRASIDNTIIRDLLKIKECHYSVELHNSLYKKIVDSFK